MRENGTEANQERIALSLSKISIKSQIGVDLQRYIELGMVDIS